MKERGEREVNFNLIKSRMEIRILNLDRINSIDYDKERNSLFVVMILKCQRIDFILSVFSSFWKNP